MKKVLMVIGAITVGLWIVKTIIGVAWVALMTVGL